MTNNFRLTASKDCVEVPVRASGSAGECSVELTVIDMSLETCAGGLAQSLTGSYSLRHPEADRPNPRRRTP